MVKQEGGGVAEVENDHTGFGFSAEFPLGFSIFIMTQKRKFRAQIAARSKQTPYFVEPQFVIFIASWAFVSWKRETCCWNTVFRDGSSVCVGDGQCVSGAKRLWTNVWKDLQLFKQIVWNTIKPTWCDISLSVDELWSSKSIRWISKFWIY